MVVRSDSHRPRESERIDPNCDRERPQQKLYATHKAHWKGGILNVNLACRHCLDLMFSGNYAEAVFEHENAHLNSTKHSRWQIDPYSNPLYPIRDEARIRYWEFSEFLAEMIRDSIANAVLESQTLQQFLEFEACKIEDHEARSPWIIDNLLWVTEVKLCADMRHLSITDLEKIASAILLQSNVLPDIHETAYAVFKKAWLASEKASKEVDLVSETRTLHENVLKHTPFCWNQCVHELHKPASFSKRFQSCHRAWKRTGTT